MKITLFTVILAALALWLGYTVGYRHGAGDESRKWSAAIHVDPDGRFVLGAFSTNIIETHLNTTVNIVAQASK